MKCDLCAGEYRKKLVTRSYHGKGRTAVVHGVPALVCDRCGDMLIRAEVAAVIDELLDKEPEPEDYAPVYCFPSQKALA